MSHQVQPSCTELTCVPPGSSTFTGTVLLAVVPFPSWPEVPTPQASSRWLELAAGRGVTGWPAVAAAATVSSVLS
jgi:hypothetical protein